MSCVYRTSCLNPTHIDLSRISGVYWSPRATTVSAVASECLWAGTTRSLAERSKWAEVTNSLWLLASLQAWICKKVLPGLLNQRTTISLLILISAWPMLLSTAADQDLMGLCFTRHHDWAHAYFCRVSARIKVSISKHGGMADTIQKYKLRLNSLTNPWISFLIIC